jgi:hypothetical protein
MSTPLWRQAFDGVERRVAAPVDQVVRSDVFSDTVALGLRAGNWAQSQVERRTRRALHLVNVPAATDVKRLSEQLAALHREVRRLQRQIEARDRDDPLRNGSAKRKGRTA